MDTITKKSLNTSFKQEVFEGLTNFPKYLSSKYIYDKKGDKLFQDIMAMPEYYLTNCEYDIIKTHTKAIAEIFQHKDDGFDLIELGAGDGKKTKVLLKYLSENNVEFNYKPIDISQNAIDSLAKNLKQELPKVKVDPEIGEYFKVLERLKTFNKRKKAIVVLGSNIGNLLHPQAIDFLSKLKDTMAKDDLLFMGFDQKKDPEIILQAYNDKAGVTAAFNKNILERINTELDANFNTKNFRHWETYDPETGTAKSFLVAEKEMTVTIDAIALNIHFEKWETIHTEISQKYDDKIVEWLAKESGLRIENDFIDKKGYYKNYIFRRKKS